MRLSASSWDTVTNIDSSAQWHTFSAKPQYSHHRRRTLEYLHDTIGRDTHDTIRNEQNTTRTKKPRTGVNDRGT